MVSLSSGRSAIFMKILWSLLCIYLITSCASKQAINNIEQRTGKIDEGRTDRYCTLKHENGLISVTATQITPESVTTVSFVCPDKRVVLAEKISQYKRKTVYRDGEGMSGGSGFAGGFLFNATSWPQPALEFHFLETIEGACFDSQPFYANGKYIVKAEPGAAANASRR